MTTTARPLMTCSTTSAPDGSMAATRPRTTALLNSAVPSLLMVQPELPCTKFGEWMLGRTSAPWPPVIGFWNGISVTSVVEAAVHGEAGDRAGVTTGPDTQQ